MQTASSTSTGYELGFRSLREETRIDSLPLHGRLPEWLTGTLVRTGPAQWEAGERTLRHWFDGLAMLHAFSFGPGGVSYANRFLESRSYRHVRDHGELGYGEFATDPCRALFKRVAQLFKPGLTDNCNVNVVKLGEEWIAMTETPLPISFDGQTLEAAGVAWRPPGQLTTAHPHLDRASGELVNYSAKLGPRSKYLFFAKPAGGAVRTLAEAPVHEPGYVHSFGITERFLILGEYPYVVNPLKLALSGRPYIENYEWKPERGSRLLVFDRSTGAVREFPAEARFVFHHVNAYEEGGELVVDVCAFDDPSIVGALYLDSLRAGGAIPAPRLYRYRIDLAAGTLSEGALAHGSLELPRIDYGRRNGRRHRYVWGNGVGETGWLDRVVKADCDTGELVCWREPSLWPGEPVFVRDPGSDDEDAGVLLSVVLDSARGASSLVVLDAATLSELARAEVPHHIPFGFHGQYAR